MKHGTDGDVQVAVFSRYAKVNFIPDVFGDLVFNDVASNVIRESLLNGTQIDTALQRERPAYFAGRTSRQRRAYHLSRHLNPRHDLAALRTTQRPTKEVDRFTQMPNLGEGNSSGRLSPLGFALTGRFLTESPACQSAEIIRDGRGLDFRSLH